MLQASILHHGILYVVSFVHNTGLSVYRYKHKRGLGLRLGNSQAQFQEHLFHSIPLRSSIEKLVYMATKQTCLAINSQWKLNT